MRRTIAVVCCLVVGAQALLVICGAIAAAWIVSAGGESPGSVTVDVHMRSGDDSAAAGDEVMSAPESESASTDASSEPPANLNPVQLTASSAASILELRSEQGSLFAGTVLGDQTNSHSDQKQFVAALREVGDLQAPPSQAPAAQPELGTIACSASGSVSRSESQPETPPNGLLADPGELSVPSRWAATRFAIQRLYEMADMDERAGDFARSDQWRALARRLRDTPSGLSPASPPCVPAEAAEVIARRPGALPNCDQP